MMNNTRAIRLTVLVLVVTSLFLLQGYHNVNLDTDRVYYFTLVVCGGIAIVVTLADVLLGQFQNKITNMLDQIYHTLAAAAMLITSTLFLVSVFQNRSTDTDEEFARRVIAGIMGFLNGIVMVNMVWILLKGEKPQPSFSTEEDE